MSTTPRRTCGALLATALCASVVAALPARAADTTPPPAPAALEAAGGPSAVGLKWSRSVASDRKGYAVYRSTSLPVPTSGTPVSGTGTIAAEELVDTGVANGTTYHYVVVAVDRAGNRSGPSPTASVTPAAPAAPSPPAITWTTKAAAALGRAEAGGTASGGKLWVFGGQSVGTRQVTRSDVYDPATDTWQQLPDLPELITHAPVVDVSGTLWILGGYLGLDKKDSTNHVWKFDTATRTYAAGPSLPAARGGGAAVLMGRTLHFFTGAVRKDSTGAATTDHADHWTLDVDGPGSWTASTPVPNPRNHVGAAVIGGKAYLVGGQHGEHEKTTPQRQVDVYDAATATFSRAADLPVPRGHISASTFVVDGKVVALGGSTVGAKPSSTFFQYDPATNAWTTRTSLPGARKSPVADVVGGALVVSGGRDTGGLATTTTWSSGSGTPPPPPPGTGAWSLATPLPASRLDPGGASVGDRMYVVSGKSSTGHRAELFAYDRTTGTWDTSLPPLPGTKVENPAVVAWNGQVLVVGGSSAAFSGAVATGYRFDPAARTWTALPSMRLPRGGPAGVVVGNALWVLGGMSGGGASLRSTERLDLTSMTWSDGPQLVTARDNPGAAVVGSRIHVFGGRTRLSSGTDVSPVLASHESLDPGSSWTARAPMPTGRRALAVGVLDGRIVAAGGERQPDGSTFPQTESYDPATGAWTAMAPMRTPRHGAAAAVLAGRLHVVAGGSTGGSSYSAVHEVFSPPVGPAPDRTPPAAPAGLTGTAVPGPQVQLSWAAGTEPDLAGYAVHRGTSTPVDTSGTPLSGTALLTTPSYTDTTVEPATTYHYVVLAKDTTGNTSPASAAVQVDVPAGPPPPTTRVDFGTATSPLGEGYLRDFGQPYGLRTGADQGSGSTYGWVRLATGQPVDLTANGRLRTGTTTTDPRLVTLVHMQHTSPNTGTAVPSRWEAQVPNGSYAVTVAVGDAANFFDSSHQLNVEDQNAVAEFVASDEDRFRTVTVVVDVSDGRLTLSPAGGANTKLLYVDYARSTSQTSPRIASVTPPNLTTGTPRDSSVVASLEVGPGGGIKPSTLNADTVHLTAAADGASVAAVVVTSAGGDVISLTPSAPLENGVSYRFSVTSGLTDSSGVPFEPWSSTFTVGSGTIGTGLDGVGFRKEATTAVGHGFTSVTTGPDGKLYAASLDGYLYRYPIAPDGSLGAEEVIDTVRTNAGGPRTVLGLAFDPAATADDLVLWVTENREYVGVANVPDWTGRIVRLSGPSLGTAQDVVVGLPRSARDHMSNSLAFGRDGALYLNQGSNSAMGAPDPAWVNRSEHLLSAAVLRLDVAALPVSLPLDVKTDDGGSYDPRAPGAPLTLYATGVRNAYDMVWHTNGQLYVPTNGSARGGNVPGTPANLPVSCDNRLDGPWTGPATPAITNNPQDETDWVFKIAPGGYYGHPNPSRCEWASHGGDPTTGNDPWEVGAYPTGVAPDRNHRDDDIFNIGLHASPNGSIEYRSSVFGPAMQGKVVVVRYSASQDLVVLDVSGPAGKVLSRTVGVRGFQGFEAPLDVTEHVPTGSLYVTELGGQRITRLVPEPPS